MAGTHEENMKDPKWLGEQIVRYKEELRKLQEKHDAQLAGIAEDKKTISSLNDALASTKEQLGESEKNVRDRDRRLEEARKVIEELEGHVTEATARWESAAALAKSRRAGLADVMNDANAKHAALVAKIAPLLAAE